MVAKTIKFPKKIVNHYIQNLEEKIKIKGVLLFGSFAWGKPTKHSDVDLVVISPDFNKRNFDQRLDLLTDIRDDITYKIAMDIIGYTPKEFTEIEKHSAIMSLAKKKGKWIYKEKNNLK
ncbi:nucleotidyltransferase domain-containing protein [Candidatus Parcubacteria bacterium]|nr:nucleotidyltransferase domain-containing protein [Candidatus Parcubacteria bacterium]